MADETKDLATREREFEELIARGRITPSGVPTAALAHLGILEPLRCVATRVDGTPCPWPPIDTTAFCTVHVGREHHERKARAADIELRTELWLEDFAGAEGPLLVKLVTSSVVLEHLRRRGVYIERIERERPGEPSVSSGTAFSKGWSVFEAATAELEDLVGSEIQKGEHAKVLLSKSIVGRAIRSLTPGIDISATSFGDAFRRHVNGELSDEDWVAVVLRELGTVTARLYLEEIYRAALHGELGWEPDAGTSPDDIRRARRAVELLQRISVGSRRGPKMESDDEAMRRIQGAIDSLKSRHVRLNRKSIAGELALTESGLDDLLRRHHLRRTRDGRVELSANN